MRTLLVDNHDSYTYNVFHLLAAASGEEPVVVNNDAVSWRVLSRSDFDAIVLSPGPGRPERWHDFGVCRDILRYSEIPVLGICLGHQGIGNLLEGGVSSAPMAMHGRLSRVRHDGTGLFAGVPQDFSVVRYHSLAITRPMGPEGHEVAWAEDGVVMGIEHRTRPMWGVQFHPESVATEHGRAIAENFYAMAERRAPSVGKSPAAAILPAAKEPQAAAKPPAATPGQAQPPAGGPISPPIARVFGPSAVGEAGSGEEVRLLSRTFPARRRRSSSTNGSSPRPIPPSGSTAPTLPPGWPSPPSSAPAPGHGAGCSNTTPRTARSRSAAPAARPSSGARSSTCSTASSPWMPWNGRRGVDRGLIGGYVGYLGYECKADCGAVNQHRSDLPDAAMMLANRVVAIDHSRAITHLFALALPGDEEAEAWLEEASEVVAAAIDAPPPERPLAAPEDPGGEVEFSCGRGRGQYLADIARCRAELAAGESYEVCLTDQISTDARPDPFELYRQLRRDNPAPFAAFLKFGEIAVVSSSPERFLSVDPERQVQARPIKGTISRCEDPDEDAARRAELAEDEKTRAEHLMIVDLLRNDLGRVSAVDSVRVPELMVVEPYATVHQVVSTITGRLEEGRSAAGCVRACFPGGSMTGAPKERTMEIIDDIEAEARGVYSGAIGYFGLDGSTDLSIVIRTIVIRPGRTTIGAGGAIVMQSDPVEEFDEILLKARAPMAAIAKAVTGREDPGAWRIELEPAKRSARAG